MRTSTPLHLLAALALALGAVACGGAYTGPAQPAATGPAAPEATSLVYTDPETSGWALVKDASSTPTHLVLNLVGPSGLRGRGVGFNLASDGTVAFHKFDDGSYLRDTGVFPLKLASPNLYETKYTNLKEPVLRVGGTKNGGRLLTVGLYMKDRRHSAQVLTAPLCQVGIDLPATGRPLAGATVPLHVVRARMIPEELGTVPQDAATGDWNSVLTHFHMDDIQIAVGTLRAQ